MFCEGGGYSGSQRWGLFLQLGGDLWDAKQVGRRGQNVWTGDKVVWVGTGGQLKRGGQSEWGHCPDPVEEKWLERGHKSLWESFKNIRHKTRTGLILTYQVENQSTPLIHQENYRIKRQGITTKRDPRPTDWQKKQAEQSKLKQGRRPIFCIISQTYQGTVPGLKSIETLLEFLVQTQSIRNLQALVVAVVVRDM